MKRIAVLEPDDGNPKPNPDPTREQLLRLVTFCLRRKDVKGEEYECILALKAALESEEVAEWVTEFFDGFFAEPGTIRLLSAAFAKYAKKHKLPQRQTE